MRFLLISVCLLCAPSTADEEGLLPSFTIDMTGVPAGERWKHVAEHYKPMAAPLRRMTRQWVPRWLQPIVWILGNAIGRMWRVEYMEELQSFSTVTEVPLGELVMLNLLYDITAFDRRHILGACTSIVACDEEGEVWHGRNLDYAMGDLIRNMTFIANFEYDGVVRVRAVMFAYFMGVLTGERVGEFAVSLNERYSGGLVDNLLMAIITRVHHPVGLAIRETLTSARTYGAAVDELSTVHLMAPCYIVVSGRGSWEGVVLTRDRWTVRDVWPLGEGNTSSWYRVETNYDHWNAAPKHDARRLTAAHALDRLGRSGMTADQMYYKVLSTPPVLNRDTLFSTVMNARRSNVMQKYTHIRHFIEQ